MNFSQRIGLEEVNTTLQVQHMNGNLRNSLWNILDICIWRQNSFLNSSHGTKNIYKFSIDLWLLHFKLPVDKIARYPEFILEDIRRLFFEYKWNEVYDFLEFVLNLNPYRDVIDPINSILERELSGYRFIETAFVEVTSEHEIKAIQEAVADVPYSGVQAHLKSALQHLARREKPDYRNSIKESISAVESMARETTGNPKATLGDALNQLESDRSLHTALKRGFSALYGYTSDEGGIRHAMLNEPNLTASDAKYFLVSCSAFINYLKSKSA